MLRTRTFGINVTGVYVVADEAYKIFEKQKLPGNVVVTTSQRGGREKGSPRTTRAKPPPIIW